MDALLIHINQWRSGQAHDGGLGSSFFEISNRVFKCKFLDRCSTKQKVLYCVVISTSNTVACTMTRLIKLSGAIVCKIAYCIIS